MLDSAFFPGLYIGSAAKGASHPGKLEINNGMIHHTTVKNVIKWRARVRGFSIKYGKICTPLFFIYQKVQIDDQTTESTNV